MIHEKDKPAFEAMISEALQSLDDDLRRDLKRFSFGRRKWKENGVYGRKKGRRIQQRADYFSH